jgi:type VI secretion system VasD/TssJ family lipoprotein
MPGLYANDAGLSTAGSSRNAAARLLLCCLLCLSGICAGCGDKSPQKPTLVADSPDNVLWPFGSKAITLRISADRDLNSFQDKPHSLQLCVYQLDGRESFDRLATPDGIDTLLQCGAFDRSVKSSTRIFLQPEEDAVHVLNRAEGASIVAVTCGFFETSPERSTRVWAIPPKVTTSGMLFWKSTTYSAGTLNLDLHLSAHALEEDISRDRHPEDHPASGKDAGPISKPAGQAGSEERK